MQILAIVFISALRLAIHKIEIPNRKPPRTQAEVPIFIGVAAISDGPPVMQRLL
jgi:hypothetical protein